MCKPLFRSAQMIGDSTSSQPESFSQGVYRSLPAKKMGSLLQGEWNGYEEGLWDTQTLVKQPSCLCPNTVQ